MGIQPSRFLALASVVLSAFGAISAHAQAVVNPVADHGKLVVSTAATVTDNLLANAPASFSFSDALGGSLSSKGYFYADYLITVSSSLAQSVTTTLTNFGGVSNLSERIYAYSGSFLGDAAAPSGVLQAWSTDIPLTGASVSVISPTNLTAGQYVVELRGTSAGTFGGTLSLSAVPEPEGLALTLAGFSVLGLAARRRRREGSFD